MEIKTSHLLIGGVLLLLFFNGENIRGTVSKGNEIRQERTDHRDRVRKNKDSARAAKDLSAIALDRYRNNCILVYDQQTGKEGYFAEGMPVIDAQLKRTLRDGASVCNRLGDTAVVQDGTIADIARVAVTDEGEMKRLIERR